MRKYDVVVVGLGAMGSAAMYALAQRGRRVIGIDRFEPGHNLGSSYGESRIIRMAYYEDPVYVPLLRLAYAAWKRQRQRQLHQPVVVTPSQAGTYWWTASYSGDSANNKAASSRGDEPVVTGFAPGPHISYRTDGRAHCH